jgi:hypothetical protein
MRPHTLAALVLLLVAASLLPHEAEAKGKLESEGWGGEPAAAAAGDDTVPTAKQPKKPKLMKLKKARSMAKELRAAVKRISPTIREVAPLTMTPSERMAAMESTLKGATTGVVEKYGFSDLVLAIEMLNAVTKRKKDKQIANHLREITALIGPGEGADSEEAEHDVDEITVEEATELLREVRDELNAPSAQALLQTASSESEQLRVLNRLLKKVLFRHKFHELGDAMASAAAAYQASEDRTLAALMSDVGALVSMAPAWDDDEPAEGGSGGQRESAGGSEADDEALETVVLEEDEL